MNNFEQQIQLQYNNFKTPAYRVNTPLRMARMYLKLINLINPKKAARTTSNWFFTPLRSKDSPKDQDTIAKAQVRKTLTLHSGRKFEAFCWGEGERKVVIGHGWESKASHFRVFIDQLLAEGFQVVSFDAPGHGHSPGSKSDVIEFGDLLFAVEKEFGKFDAAIGHSLGGLALINAIKRGFEVPKAFIISAPTCFPEVLHKYAKILTLPESLHMSLRESVKSHFSMDDSIWDKFTAYKGLETVKTEAIIIHDEHDEEVLMVEAEALANAWPNAKLVKTQGLGHKKIIKSDDVVNQVVSALN